MRVREVKFYGAIESSVILEDDDICYLAVYYEDSKSIYSYYKDEEVLRELVSTSDFRCDFFMDIDSKRIYQYYKKMNFLIVEDVTEGSPKEVFNYIIDSEKKLVSIVAIKGHLILKLKNKKSFTEGILFSIESNSSYKIKDRAFLETVGKGEFFKREDVLYLILEESYYEAQELVELRKSYGEIEFCRNAVILYEVEELIDEIKREKNFTKNLLIDSTGENYVSFLGIDKDRIVVFSKSNKNKLIYFSIDDNIIFRTLKREVKRMVTKGESLIISSKNKINEVIDKENNVIFSYKDIEENPVDIRGIFNERILVYSENDNKGNKKINLYDLLTGSTKSFKSDFLTIDKQLI